MKPSSRDRISVDLRGLKAALVDRAKVLGLSPSGLVRSTLAVALGTDTKAGEGDAQARPATGGGPRVRLCLRMSRLHASTTIQAARCAGLSPGDYVAGLVTNVPVLAAGGSRGEYLNALVASCSELSTLSRNIHRLTTLLRQANVDAARPYREMLEGVASDVRRHLEIASNVLAELQPHHRAANGASRSLGQTWE